MSDLEFFPRYIYWQSQWYYWLSFIRVGGDPKHDFANDSDNLTRCLLSMARTYENTGKGWRQKRGGGDGAITQHRDCSQYL